MVPSLDAYHLKKSIFLTTALYVVEKLNIWFTGVYNINLKNNLIIKQKNSLKHIFIGEFFNAKISQIKSFCQSSIEQREWQQT